MRNEGGKCQYPPVVGWDNSTERMSGGKRFKRSVRKKMHEKRPMECYCREWCLAIVTMVEG